MRPGARGKKARTRKPIPPWTPWRCVSALGSQNPDIVLVHYLNVPALEDCGKGCSPMFCSISGDRREWLKWPREELLGQLKPMCKARGGLGRHCWGLLGACGRGPLHPEAPGAREGAFPRGHPDSRCVLRSWNAERGGRGTFGSCVSELL